MCSHQIMQQLLKLIDIYTCVYDFAISIDFVWIWMAEAPGAQWRKINKRKTENNWTRLGPQKRHRRRKGPLGSYMCNMSKRGGPLSLRYFFFHLDPKYHHCSVNNLKIIYAVNIRYKFSDFQKKVKYNLINKRTKLVLLFLFRFNIIEYACDEPT